MECLQCGSRFTSLRRGSPQKFCSEYCRHRWWKLNNRKRVRELNQKYYSTHKREQSIKYKLAIKKWVKENKIAISCHQKVERAIKNGVLIKPKLCSNCNRKTKLHAHHDDYSKPLEVLWLCGSCHRLRHSSLP